MAALEPLRVPCTACGHEIELPARLCLSPKPEHDGTATADLLLDLDPARQHARTHTDDLPTVLAAVLGHFGVPW